MSKGAKNHQLSSRQYFLTAALLAGLVVRAFPAYAQTEVVSVKAEGSAATKSLAVTSALVQAISMVNGVAIAAQTPCRFSRVIRSVIEGEVTTSILAFLCPTGNYILGEPQKVFRMFEAFATG